MAANARADRHPGGRPTIGAPVKWALPAPLRSALRAALRPGESEAAAARRLLAAALDLPTGPDEFGDFRQLAERWEAHAAKLPRADRYRAGLEVAADQLRDIIAQTEADTLERNPEADAG
jgi:hypothetical protein